MPSSFKKIIFLARARFYPQKLKGGIGTMEENKPDRIAEDLSLERFYELTREEPPQDLGMFSGPTNEELFERSYGLDEYGAD